MKAQALGRPKCVCDAFSFLSGTGAEDYFKRPSVMREHIASCPVWPADDPLKRLCFIQRKVAKEKAEGKPEKPRKPRKRSMAQPTNSMLVEPPP